jgi:hypothetical protein
MAESPQKKTTERKLDLIRPKDGIPCIYTNNIRIGQTVYDLRIIFGEITEVTEERFEVTERMQVTMSWLEAKVLSEFLSSQIRIFEERNGPIKTTYAKAVNPPPVNIPLIIDPEKMK